MAFSSTTYKLEDEDEQEKDRLAAFQDGSTTTATTEPTNDSGDRLAAFQSTSTSEPEPTGTAIPGQATTPAAADTEPAPVRAPENVTESGGTVIGGGDPEGPTPPDEGTTVGGGDPEGPTPPDEGTTVIGGGDPEGPTPPDEGTTVIGGGDPEGPGAPPAAPKLGEKEWWQQGLEKYGGNLRDTDQMVNLFNDYATAYIASRNRIYDDPEYAKKLAWSAFGNDYEAMYRLNPRPDPDPNAHWSAFGQAIHQSLGDSSWSAAFRSYQRMKEGIPGYGQYEGMSVPEIRERFIKDPLIGDRWFTNNTVDSTGWWNGTMPGQGGSVGWDANGNVVERTGQYARGELPDPQFPNQFWQDRLRSLTTTATVGGHRPGAIQDGANAPWLSNLWNTVNNQPRYGSVNPETSQGLGQLNDRSQQFAMDMLNNPTRYDTDLFKQLLDHGLGRIDQSAEKDRLNTLRGSLKRLGPNSGQLTNEYIDLAAEHGNQRTGLLNNLLREAAMTQSQDRMAALNGASGWSNQMFGQGAALRGEQRQERDFQSQDRLRQINELLGFGNVDRQLGRDAKDDWFREWDMGMKEDQIYTQMMQQEFMNAIGLSQIFNNMRGDPGAVDAGFGDPDEPYDLRGGDGDNNNPPAPYDPNGYLDTGLGSGNFGTTPDGRRWYYDPRTGKFVTY
jgi:hypothetical protein